jgi:PAS domain S-box-containing protein
MTTKDTVDNNYEKKLLQSVFFGNEHNLMTSLVQFSNDAIVAMDLDGKVLSWNNGAERIYGFTASEMIGGPITKLILLEVEDELPLLIKTTVAGMKTGHYDTKRIRKDGKIIDVSQTVSPIKDENGNVIAISIIARDVTVQKEILKQSEQYARSLIEASLDPLVTISVDGKITDVNEATIKVTGISRESLIGSDFSDYFIEPENAREGYKQVFAKGFVADYPLTIRHKDGKLTDVLYNASVYKDVRGNVLGVFAAARDVTTQKQASQYARSLIEASLDPLVTISPDGKITDVNEATIKVTGRTELELVGSDFSNYFTEVEKAREGYKQVFAKGFVADYPLTIRHKDGKLTDVLYNASVYKDIRGNVLGVFAAARDVTAKNKAEKIAAEQHTSEMIQTEQAKTLEKFRRMATVIQDSNDAITFQDLEGNILAWNRGAELMYGYSEVEALKMNIVDTVPKEYQAEAREFLASLKRGELVATLDTKRKTKDGKIVDVWLTNTKLTDDKGQLTGIATTERDVTSQKQAEKEVKEQRARELDRIVELERFQKLTVGRELKMIELKKEIEEMKKNNVNISAP